MTLPYERTRALRWAGEFLREIVAAGELSEQQQREVRGILRHYPSEDEIKRHAKYGDGYLKIGGPWLGPEEDAP